MMIAEKSRRCASSEFSDTGCRSRQSSHRPESQSMLFRGRSGKFVLWTALAIGCGSGAQAATHCDDLVHLRIPKTSIGLPTRGAIVDTAKDYAPDKDLPATCRITGAILPHTAGAPPIRFQLNLPVGWNGKALQLGGGGLDGKVVDGLHDMPGNAPVSAPPPNPLARGFATFGSDGGHEGAGPFDGAFGRNAEARANYAGEAVKRVHDAAIVILRAFYGQAPRRVYFAGGSKGGHEGLVAAQRYGSDYDGVIAFYPAKDSVALIFAWGALTQAAYGNAGGALSPEKQGFLHKAILSACDKLDGIEDGLVSNVRACAASISPSSFRCEGGSASDDCLTPQEIDLLDAAQAKRKMPFPLANGITSIGPFPVMEDAPLDRTLLSSSGRSATVYDGFVKAIVRDFWTLDPGATLETLDTKRFRDQILAYSAQADATSTDLDAFAAHGGKLILVQGTDDMLVPPSATTDYFVRLAGRYGTRTHQIARYFVQPGYSHGFGAFDLSWDSLAALDLWVEAGRFPERPIAVDGNPATRDRQMPLCEYPLFPRYIGGDAKQALSYSCTSD